MKIFERRDPYREAARDTLKETASVDVILVGMGNYGSGLAETCLRRNKAVLGVDFDPDALERWRKRGVSVLYGDMADPDMVEQLPLNKARWVISTVRSREMNLALVHNLRKEGYGGKVALTATNEQEAKAFRTAGAHLIFCPFKDATEQAADALTSAMDLLPDDVDWPISFLEVRIRSDASAAGDTLRELRLSTAGISILGVSRGGQVYYDPGPDFRIFPTDRVLLMGPPVGLKDAENMLNQLETRQDAEASDRFDIAEIRVSDDSPISGLSLADLRFRQAYGANLVGIRRGQEQIMTIRPDERIRGGDHLIVFGKAQSVRELKQQEPL